MIAIAAVVVIAAVCIFDTVMNWDRAYGNIFINGVNVGGMNSEEMQQTLQEEVGAPLFHTQVTIYADDEARQKMLAAMAAAEGAAQGQQTFSEEDQVEVDYWMTDAYALKASLPYESAIQEAISVGRSDGGIFRRMALTFQPAQIEMGVSLDPVEIEHLANSIDEAIGQPRQDTTVQIANAWATVLEGHSGILVNREWLNGKLCEALMSHNTSNSFLAELSDAPSRITRQQAELLCTQLNHALGCDALFTYEDNRYEASDIDLGDWTQVEVVPDGEGFALKPSINSSRAIPAIVTGADARVKSDDTHAFFEKSPTGIMVRTDGTGEMPEVAAAADELNQQLYGPDGYAYTDKTPTTIQISIGETDKPESLTLEQALNLGIVTVIGEYTTDFSNYVGTENRNHNIRLVADILNNGVIGANGGIWSFNDESGDTNEEAGFWAAGSIVNGEITDSIGGGICQVATTIFNAVYEAGLKVPERHNHTMYMANYPDGRDAGVSYPDLDLIWRNDLSSDILLTLSYTDSSITCKLYSVYTGYTAKTITGEWQEGEKYSVRFVEDESLAKGAYYLKSEGEDGRKITIERVVSDADGNFIFNDSFTSLYEPDDETYAVGPGTDTKELEEKFKKKEEEKAKAEAEEKAKAEEQAKAEESEGSGEAKEGSAA